MLSNRRASSQSLAKTVLRSPIAIINDCLWGIFLDGIHFQDRAIESACFAPLSPGRLPSAATLGGNPRLLFSIFNSEARSFISCAESFVLVSRIVPILEHIRTLHIVGIPPVAAVQHTDTVCAGMEKADWRRQDWVRPWVRRPCFGVLSRHLLRHTHIVGPAIQHTASYPSIASLAQDARAI